MMDEQEMIRQWNIEQSKEDYEKFLDDFYASTPRQDEGEMHDEQQEPAEPPCTCYYTDVDVVENRYCEAHGPRF